MSEKAQIERRDKFEQRKKILEFISTNSKELRPNKRD